MKKYVTFVKDAEESRRVQKALFSAGFSWWGGGRHFNTKVNPCFIFINDDESIFLRRGVKDIFDNTKYAPLIKSQEYTFFSPQDIISDPFQLDGATKPEEMITVAGKEYSESTLMSALRQYVG